MRRQDNQLGAKLDGSRHRHGRVNAKLASGVRTRGDHAAVFRFSTYRQRFGTQGWVEQFFHGAEEGVQIKV
jgi:hypothetical protein